MNTDQHRVLPRAEEEGLTKGWTRNSGPVATSARRENHQPVSSVQRRGWQTFRSRHVSSPWESVTFHKEMLTIKRVR